MTLDNLGDMLASQFLGGENSVDKRTLSGKLSGVNNNFAKLGDFAKKIDQSAQRNYVEEGYLANNYGTATAKLIEITMQEPTATVLVKKKMFSSLIRNFDVSKFSLEERLTYQAMDRLFLNKSKQISSYEKLCKFQNAASKSGEIDEQLLPFLIGLGDNLAILTEGSVYNSYGNGSFYQAIRSIKNVINYSGSSFYTKWVEDIITPMYIRKAIGTGVMEFTNFTNLSTNCNVNGSTATFSANFDDPYEIMTVTLNDVEMAINDVLSTSVVGGKLFNSSLDTSEELINKKINQLNKVRRARGASPISFKINPNTIYGKKVTAIVDATGQEILFEADPFQIQDANISPPYLLGGEALGFQGISTNEKSNKLYGNVRSAIHTSELSLFSDAVNNIFINMSLNSRSVRNSTFNNSDLINYVRRKLTFYFAGKNVIQPMDTINVYMSSRAKNDTKIMSGISNALSGFGLFKNLNTQWDNFSNSLSSTFSPTQNVDVQVEKSVFLGNTQFPNYIWSMMRDQFTSSKEGTHVYAGVVTSVNSRYGDGNFSVSVNGEDNTYYLKMGAVNYNPGTDETGGSIIYNPLTPYKTSFDQVYSMTGPQEYLDENKENIDSGLLFVNKGPNAGGVPTTVAAVINPSDNAEKKLKKVFYSPDGLVYKWKEGIGLFNSSGPSDDIFKENNVGQQKTAADSLSGQDIINVVSLLVSGVPYNYSSFYRAGINAGGINLDQKNSTFTTSRLSQLTQAITRNNAVWGNFIPFKSITLSDNSFTASLSPQYNSPAAQYGYVFNAQSNLSGYYTQLRNYQNLAITIQNSSSSIKADPQVKTLLSSIQQRTSEINSFISNKEKEFSDFITTNNVSIVGTDVSLETDDMINNQDSGQEIYRRKIRRKLNFLTRRMSWKVRSNKDSNYFIVDDSYDKNYDIFAFENNFQGNNIGLYNNEYVPVIDKINAAVKMLDLEFFADTQGHLRVRSPQYNRIPSSVFATMIMNKKSKKNIQIFPNFLNDLMFNQIKSLYNQITVTEDYIRLFTALAGAKNNLESDQPSIEYIITNTTKKTSKFKFISDPRTGEIYDFYYLSFDAPIQYTFYNAQIESGTKNNSFTKIKVLNNVLQTQLNIQNAFDIGGRLSALNNKVNSSLTSPVSPVPGVILNTLVDRIYKKSGIKENIQDYIFNGYYGVSVATSDLNNVNFTGFQPDYNKIDSLIAKKIEERQKYIKNMFNAIKSAYEINSLDDNAINLFLNSGPNSNKQSIPEIFESMIEDEDYDDYGPDSGKRYIIRNYQIRDYSINERMPEYTAVAVTGRLSKDLTVEQSGQGFKQLPGVANALLGTTAVDYDLWKMYGFKYVPTIDKPFLTNVTAQTGPFAASLLAKQRKKIIGGSITITGNEYMQPGEVIYLEQKGMLFYVESVSHSMQMGSSFTTTLNVSFGHYPGEYIPTVLDIAGKMLYNNREQIPVDISKANIDIVNGKSIGAFTVPIIDPETHIGDEKDKIYFIGDHDKNSKINLDLLKLVSNTFSQQSNNYNRGGFELELRLVIYNDQNNSNKSESYAQYIRNLLTGDEAIIGVEIPTFKENKISIKTIDISPQSAKTRRESPSFYALSAATSIVENDPYIKSLTSGAANPLSPLESPALAVVKKKKALCGYIIDCFIKEVPQK
jgi:hypothetical protein